MTFRNVTPLDYEELQPRLEKLKEAHEEDLATAADLERRIANVLKLYSTRVCSPPFV